MSKVEKIIRLFVILIAMSLILVCFNVILEYLHIDNQGVLTFLHIAFPISWGTLCGHICNNMLCLPNKDDKDEGDK